ncbi:MAG: hypothetical protein ACEQSB_05690 [Undibacterium sp.]
MALQQHTDSGSDGSTCSPSSLTPETDAFEASQHPACRFPAVLEKMRTLERERDGARSALDAFRDRIFDLEDVIHVTLLENLHLADGDDCTLKQLKDAIGFELPPENELCVVIGER